MAAAINFSPCFFLCKVCTRDLVACIGIGMEEQRCSICLTQPPAEPASLNCGHEYCWGCIQRWCRTRKKPRCPLCQTPIQHLIHDGGQKELPPADQLAEDGPDLQCLDHSYFRAESDRLLCRARAAQMQIVRSAYGCGRRGSTAAHDASDTLQQVIDTLEATRADMQHEVPFQPEAVLHELYSLDQLVRSIASGGWTAASSGAALEQAPSARFSADDAAAGLHEWHDSSDGQEDEYSDSDDAGLGSQMRHRLERASLGSTPGRRPTPGRRGSSGNLNGRRR